MQVGWAWEDIIHRLDQELESYWFCLPKLCRSDLLGKCMFPIGPSSLQVHSHGPAVVFLLHLHPDLTLDQLPFLSPLRSLASACLNASFSHHFLPVLTTMPAEETLESDKSLYSSTSLALVTPLSCRRREAAICWSGHTGQCYSDSLAGPAAKHLRRNWLMLCLKPSKMVMGLHRSTVATGILAG